MLPVSLYSMYYAYVFPATLYYMQYEFSCILVLSVVYTVYVFLYLCTLCTIYNKCFPVFVYSLYYIQYMFSCLLVLSLRVHMWSLEDWCLLYCPWVLGSQHVQQLLKNDYILSVSAILVYILLYKSMNLTVLFLVYYL